MHACPAELRPESHLRLVDVLDGPNAVQFVRDAPVDQDEPGNGYHDTGHNDRNDGQDCNQGEAAAAVVLAKHILSCSMTRRRGVGLRRPNAYIFTASGDNAIVFLSHCEQDLTHHAACSERSKMLQDAPRRGCCRTGAPRGLPFLLRLPVAPRAFIRTINSCISWRPPTCSHT